MIRHVRSVPSFPAQAGIPLCFNGSAVTYGGYVYMMSDRYRGSIYTGVAANISARATQHREGQGSAFAAKYGLKKLVYTERHERIEEAIAREKAIKKWRRAWKIDLIESMNPDWDDLYDILNG